MSEELLERHRPVLRYDRQYDYRLAAVDGVVENAGNLLRRVDGEVIARVRRRSRAHARGAQRLPGRREPRRATTASAWRPTSLGDARRMETESACAARLYGRALEDGGRTWLQYWFWLYYNPKNLFGFGKHEGDWEMIQLGLDEHGELEVATYAQHDGGEARGRDEIEWIERDGGHHPVVYVAPLSHASYFEPRTHPYPIGIDHPYGDGPEVLAPVVPFGDLGRMAGALGQLGARDRAPHRQRPAQPLPPAPQMGSPGRCSTPASSAGGCARRSAGWRTGREAPPIRGPPSWPPRSTNAPARSTTAWSRPSCATHATST